MCLLPTRWGCLVVLAILAGLGFLAVRNVYPFLAQRNPYETGPVVVEGWARAETFRVAIEEFRRHHTPVLYVTGGVLDEDLSAITHQTSFAELGVIRLQELGLTREEVQPIPTGDVRRDRTLASGMALRNWMEAHGGLPAQLTIVTEGPHARRSRLLFQQAFGRATQVGVLAALANYERNKRWWNYSEGFRSVTDELIAYLYASALFWRPGV